MRHRGLEQRSPTLTVAGFGARYTPLMHQRFSRRPTVTPVNTPPAKFAAFAVGLAAGIVVTRRSHRAPASPGWAIRVGRTRLRRSDLPVGGTLALAIALLLSIAGRRTAASLVAALGAGAAAGAVATGLADPLAA